MKGMQNNGTVLISHRWLFMIYFIILLFILGVLECKEKLGSTDSVNEKNEQTLYLMIPL